MTHARILSVCVGISACPPGCQPPGERPPRFFADNARDLSGHFAALWPGDGSRHMLVVDEAATLPNVGALVAAETGRYDCFVFYLGGHGGVGRGAFEFLFSDAAPGDPVISAAVIDALVAIPRAENILLLLDCGCSGGYADETLFFRAVTPGAIRVCIASSRRHQESWEDPQLRRSLFTDAIIASLVRGDDLDYFAGAGTGGLFKAISANITRHARELGGGITQEPLLIGAVRAVPIRAAAGRRARSAWSKSTGGRALRQSLRIMLGALFVGVSVFAALSMMLWHPAVNEDSYVELRAGPAWWSRFEAGPWRLRVETEATGADLRPGAASSMPDAVGILRWAEFNDAQLRGWVDNFLDGYLNAEAAARWRVRLGYDNAVERLGSDNDRAVGVDSATELAAEAVILDPARPLTDVWKRQWREYVVPGSCAGHAASADPGPSSDRYQHRAEPEAFARWLRGLALTARVDDALGLDEVVRLVEMFVAIASAETSVADPGAARPTIDEIAALAAIASAIVSRRTAGARDAIEPSEQTGIAAMLQGCGDLAMPVLAALGSHGDPARVTAWARARPETVLAQYVLHELAVHAALPVDEIVWQLRARGFADARTWLLEISDVMPLPEDVLALLLGHADARLSAGDADGAREALAVALSSPAAAPFMGEIRGLLERILPEGRSRKTPAKNVLPLTRGELELLGLLARSGNVLTGAQRKTVVNVLERGDYRGLPRVHYSNPATGGSRAAAQITIVVNSAHLLALSRFIISVRAEDKLAGSARTLDFLRQAIADASRARVPLASIQDAITAAALVRNRRAAGKMSAPDVRDELRKQAGDASSRMAQVEIIKAALSLIPGQQAARLIDELRNEWRREHEPETKLALAEIIVGATARGTVLSPPR
ncbi:MAG: hypothetical protein IT488_01915 [Gammaproteobacteria bacterium]|nr:hypothetical protein [Gammaproteobacteria bacterium]